MTNKTDKYHKFSCRSCAYYNINANDDEYCKVSAEWLLDTDIWHIEKIGCASHSAATSAKKDALIEIKEKLEILYEKYSIKTDYSAEYDDGRTTAIDMAIQEVDMMIQRIDRIEQGDKNDN